MTIPKITPYTGGVANPDGSQTQTEFTQNMFDQLSYEANLSTELNNTVDEINDTAIQVDADAAGASQSAAAAEAAVSGLDYQGLWPDTGGSANKGETWQAQAGGTPTGQYFTALQSTTVDPISDDVNWREVVSVSILNSENKKQDDLLKSNAGASLVGTSRGISAQNYFDVIDSNLWFTQGDGSPTDIVYDMNYNGGFTESGGLVSSIASLGRQSGSLTPTGSSATLANSIGVNVAKFDPSVSRYNGLNSYASSFLTSERAHFGASAYIPRDSASSDQVRIGVGESGTGKGWRNLDDSNQISRSWVHNPVGGSSVNYAQNPNAFSDGEIQTNSVFHNGIDECSQWSNGICLQFKSSETTVASQPDLGADELTIGGTSNDIFSLNGDFIAGCIDNNSTLSIDNAYEKYRYLHLKYQGNAIRSADVIRCIGQSNAEGNFPNPSLFGFSEDVAYLKQTVGVSTQGVFIRDGFTQGQYGIAESNLGIWFADEWKKLTSRTPLYQVISRGGTPITPGVSGTSDYWAPKNAIGDSAGQNSMNELFAADFQRMTDLKNYSPEFSVGRDICLVFEGEADGVAFNASDPAITDQATLESWINAWLDQLISRYGVNTFAIVNIGRFGNTLALVNSNAPGVEFVRDAWSSVIRRRADCYDVFPHLNHVPNPFALDDLIVDSDGAWVSGQANNADGVHYTPEMYQAIARTAARNLFSMV